MMVELARSVATRACMLLDPRTGAPTGRLYLVRPPRVGEALTVLAVAEGVRQGEPSHVEALLEKLRRWLLPEGAWRVYDSYRVLLGVEATRVAALYHVLQLIGEGVWARPGRKPQETSRRLRDVTQAPWDIAIRQYAALFGCTPAQVLDAPWPLFLSTMGWPDALRAQEALERLRVNALPYVKNARTRERSLERLKHMADLDRTPRLEDLSEDDRRAQYRRNQDALEAQFRRMAGLPPTGSDPTRSHKTGGADA